MEKGGSEAWAYGGTNSQENRKACRLRAILYLLGMHSASCPTSKTKLRQLLMLAMLPSLIFTKSHL